MAQKVAVKESQMVTVAQSTAVMKNCVRLAISTVAFARELFPKEAFTSKSYGGVNIEVLRPTDSSGTLVNEQALRLQDWLEKGAFKALDEGYLEKVTFNILDGHPSDSQAKVIESYAFRVTTATAATNKGVNVSLNKRQATGTTITTTTTLKEGFVSKEEVHNTMQQLIRTLLMLTSSLEPLPTTRWLSMSITYSEAAPLSYEVPEFVPQDPSAQPKFQGEEPLVIPVGEVNTGFHTVSLKFRQAVSEDDKNVASTQRVAHDDGGYDSDCTDVRWQKDKQEIIAMAERIARNAQASGEPVEAAVRESELAKALPENVLSEILAVLKIDKDPPVVKRSNAQAKPEHQTSRTVSATPTIVTAKRVSRVKRPIQQISSTVPSNDAKDCAENPADTASFSKKPRATYSKRV